MQDKKELLLFPVVQIRRAGMPWQTLSADPFDANGVVAHWQTAVQQALSLRETWMQLAQTLLAECPAGEVRTRLYNQLRKWRKNVPTRPFQLSAQFPDALTEAIAKWSEAVGHADAAWEQVAQHYESQRCAETAALQAIAGEEHFQRALLFTSHDLLKVLPAWITQHPAHFTRKERQIARSVWQYTARSVTKISPRSRFTTTGAWMPIGDHSTAQHKIVPNAALLPMLYEVLLKEPAFRAALSVRLNPCITRIETTLYRWIYHDGEQEGWQECAAIPALSLVVEAFRSRERTMPFTAVCDLVSEATGEEQAVQSFILELLDTGFLEWEWPENGLSAGWCGQLYQFLGWLPLQPLIVETAALLQWLRTTARTLPFQSVQQALQNMEEGVALCHTLAVRAGMEIPPLTPEQLFFEEVLHTQETPAWHDALSSWVFCIDPLLENEDHAQGQDAKKWPFLDWTEAFLKKNTSHTDFLKQHGFLKNTQRRIPAGALLQPFREAGQWKAVVQATYPGGGRLLARWLPWLPPSAAQAHQQWLTEIAALSFPWQPWSNAAFQPSGGRPVLNVPGGRLSAPSDTLFLLGDAVVCCAEEGWWLEDRLSGQRLTLADLALDAPSERPPLMQLLGHLGHGWGNRSEQLRHKAATLARAASVTESGVVFHPRSTAGSVVLQRAYWRIAAEVQWTFPAVSPSPYSADTFISLRRQLKKWGIPRYFFVQTADFSAKPQYVDQESVLAMQIFEKIVRFSQDHILPLALIITEMLPVPGQTAGGYAEEIALEWK